MEGGGRISLEDGSESFLVNERDGERVRERNRD